MNTLLLILKLFPLLLATIQAIETTAPVSGAGPAKLQLLTATVKSGLTDADFAPNTISEDQLLQWIQAITASIVTFYNLVGVFKTAS